MVKAQIQFDDSRVALQDGQLALENARVALALMVFPDVNQKFEAVDDPAKSLTLPSFDEAEAAARHHNPALDAAFRAVRMASSDVTAARAEYLPTMTFDYFYGIDANHFAMETPSSLRLDPELDGRANPEPWIFRIGIVDIAHLELGRDPQQGEDREELKQQAVQDREFAQRKLIADLKQFYGEAKVAKSELRLPVICRKCGGEPEADPAAI